MQSVTQHVSRSAVLCFIYTALPGSTSNYIKFLAKAGEAGSEDNEKLSITGSFFQCDASCDFKIKLCCMTSISIIL